MNIRLAAMIFTLATPLYALAQENMAVRDKEAQVKPEEITIIGERVRKLRTQMWEAEIQTYDVFNKYNDDKRYVINCSVRAPTGTRFKKVICNTGFELEAMQQQARDPGDNPEAKIAAQREGFRLKMKQVAEQHPDFLQAVIRYTEKQKEFEAATTTGKQQD